jgi:Vacuolar-sorting associated protein 13, adaptor binding domain
VVAVYEVSFRRASQILCLRSNVLIQNATTVSLDALVLDGLEEVLLDTIAPGDVVPVPLRYTRHGRISFRPNFADADYEWSTQFFELHGMPRKKKRGFVVDCQPAGRMLYPFLYHVCLSPADPDSETFMIQLHPPLHVENLLSWSLNFKVCVFGS